MMRKECPITKRIDSVQTKKLHFIVTVKFMPFPEFKTFVYMCMCAYGACECVRMYLCVGFKL